MKSLCDLLEAVCLECEQRCGTSTAKDIRYIRSRCGKEGEAEFLGITLGNFCDDFERSLALESVSSTAFLGFKKATACLPALLQGFTRMIFHSDGALLPNPSVEAIRSIRQICRFAKKVSLPCSSDRVTGAFEGYKELEAQLALWGPQKIDESSWKTFQLIADILWARAPLFEWHPNHGTGAVAEKLTQSEKYSPTYWYHRATQVFPPEVYCFNSILGWLDECSKVELLAPEQELPIRVISVPKTLKGPRIIGIEASLTQRLQQSVLRQLVPWLESDPLFRSVRFTDQSVNAKLALEGSRNGNYATLDLKEASDRVHKDVVWHMLRRAPQLRDAVFASRSTHSSLPDGTIIPLSKFASMGSALCFPMEATVFYCIIQAAIHRQFCITPSQASIKRFGKKISVYGDDIIVPTDVVPSVVAMLEAFALKVNTTKSFWTGKFRESCGEDAYEGQRVTPFYLRSMLPTTISDVTAIVSAVSLMWQAYKAGHVRLSVLIHDHLTSVGVKLVTGDDRSPYLSTPFESNCVVPKRYNHDLQRSMIRAVKVVCRAPIRDLDGWSAWTRVSDLNDDRDQATWDWLKPKSAKISVANGRPTVTLKPGWII